MHLGSRKAVRAIAIGVLTWSVLVIVVIARDLGSSDRASAPSSNETLTGGKGTVFDESREAFGFPFPSLNKERRAAFFVGNSFFKQNWVAAPASTAARDGLGPLFNARSCSTCHFKDGRGQPPNSPTSPLTSAVLRLSIPGVDGQNGPIPEPVYGGQIQGSSLPRVASEAQVLTEYRYIEGTFASGETYTLRMPVVRLERVGYGPLAAEAMMSCRVAPAMIGLGLLEAVPDNTLEAMADPDDRDGDGISGAINRVWDRRAGRVAVGRFGWKAEQPSLIQQIAAALQQDMGLTTTLFRSENHTAVQKDAGRLPNGGDPEVNDEILQAMVEYTRALAVPAARNLSAAEAIRGRQVFQQLRCAVCHQPELKTGMNHDYPELSEQIIRPYSDLLLHDMGDGLSDRRPVFTASGREWRTPPLWGLGLTAKVSGHSTLLHDGRARDVTEAILWHGGEAETAREQFRSLSREDRNALVVFLQSL